MNTLQQSDRGLAVDPAARDRAISHLVMRGDRVHDADRHDVPFSPGAPEDDSPFQFGRQLRQRRMEPEQLPPPPPMIAVREFAVARYDAARSLAFTLGCEIASHKVWIDASWRHEKPEKDRRLIRIATLDARRCRLLVLCARINPNQTKP